MTNRKLIERMDEHKPFTPQDTMRKCGFTLRFIGIGSYREVYEIVGTPWVIKFPLTEWDSKRYGPLVDWLKKHRIHAHHEMNAYHRIKSTKSMRGLCRYLPKMMWADWETGVLIVEKCEPLELGKALDASFIAHKAFRKHFKKSTDITNYNVGKNAKGVIKVIDMGLLEVEGDEASTDTSAS